MSEGATERESESENARHGDYKKFKHDRVMEGESIN